MDQLDLDINNYNINEIETFFKFKKNSKYTAADVDKREAELRQQLLASGHIDKRFVEGLHQFLSKAKEMLIQAKCPPPYKPTSIPKNYQLDPAANTYPGIPIEGSRKDDLIQRPTTDYVFSQNSDFLPGQLNPLKTRVISKCLTIDTRFRNDYYGTKSSDFMFQLPMKLNKVVQMQMSSFEIPVAFYGISASYGNNYLYIKITYENPGYDDIPIEEERIFTIPDGNYNAQDFIDIINTTVAPTNADGTPVDPNNMYSYLLFTLGINDTGSGTGKVTLTTNGTLCHKILSIDLDFTRNKQNIPDTTDVSTRIGWNLGFTKRTYTGATTYVGETLIEPATIRYIYLAIDDFNNSVNNNFITAFNNSILSPNIIARISIKGSYFSLLMENDLSIMSEPRSYFGPVDIQRMQIRLYDERGRILDMNGANFSFCLVFKMLYDL